MGLEPMTSSLSVVEPDRVELSSRNYQFLILTVKLWLRDY